LLLMLVSAGWDDAKQESGGAERSMSSYDVARRGTATVGDAYRLFLSMASSHGRVTLPSDVDELSFEQVAIELRRLCIIDSTWCYEPQTCLRRDVLAYMTCCYLGCKPGLLTSYFGMTRRYAHREMLYRKMIAPGAPATLVSGSELLSVATRVSRRLETRDVQLTSDEIH
jgi:hypothetical protein